MAAGLVEDDTAEGIGDGHGHDTCGAVTCTGHGDGLLGRLDAHVLGVHDVEHLQTHAAAGGRHAGLGFAVLLSHGLDHHAGADLAVLGVETLGAGHQNVAVHAQDHAADLTDGLVIVLGGEIAFLQDLHLLCIGHGGGNGDDGVDIAEDALFQHDVDAGRTLAQSLGGLLGAADQAGFGGVDGGCHDASQTLEDTDGGTGHHGVLDAVHLGVDHVDGMIGGVFSEDLRIVRTGGCGLLEDPLTDFS